MTLKQISAFLASAAFALSAWAHGGEDHGDGAHGQAMPAADLAPRAVAATEELELVAVQEGGKLVLYVDRYASNEPLADAQVEVEGGGLKGAAVQVAPGVYSLPAPALAPGKHALAISVQAGDLADLLTATLDLAPPAAGTEHTHLWGEWAVWGSSGALLLAGVGLIAVRRRKKNGKH